MCETYNVLALSTAHLSPEDLDILQKEAEDPDEWMVMSREPGFFIKLYCDDTEKNLRDGYSDTIIEIIKYACTKGFQMIEFDRDAAVCGKFPTYDF